MLFLLHTRSWESSAIYLEAGVKMCRHRKFAAAIATSCACVKCYVAVIKERRGQKALHTAAEGDAVMCSSAWT